MSHELPNDIIFSVTLPNGRVVTSPSGFDKPGVSENLRRTIQFQEIVYEVTLEDGTVVTGPSHFPDTICFRKYPTLDPL